MRQLNNKHFDTIEGASALPGEIVSSQFAPSVSQKDEKMTKEQRDLLILLVRTERRRINYQLMDFPNFCRQRVELILERNLCTETLKSLQEEKGGK